METDNDEIQAKCNWPIPRNLRKLRGFLGLTGYYRRFVLNYSLAIPDFNMPFVIEIDASGTSFGAILSQKQCPIAYFRQVLSARARTKSIYELELMAIVVAVQKWRHYSWVNVLWHVMNNCKSK